MRRGRQEVLIMPLIAQAEIRVKVRYVSLDANIAVSIPFESTKPGASERIFICANQEFYSSYGVSIIIFRCDTSRCASKQADGNAPSNCFSRLHSEDSIKNKCKEFFCPVPEKGFLQAETARREH